MAQQTRMRGVPGILGEGRVFSTFKHPGTLLYAGHYQAGWPYEVVSVWAVVGTYVRPTGTAVPSTRSPTSPLYGSPRRTDSGQAPDCDW
jgi:hypothetical protein